MMFAFYAGISFAAPKSMQATSITSAKVISDSISSKTSILEIQQKLIDAKLYSGKADGVLNQETISSVKDFQLKNNLKVDGVVGAETYNLLSQNSISAAAATVKIPTINLAPKTIPTIPNASISSHINMNPGPLSPKPAGPLCQAGISSVTVTSPNGGQVFLAGQQVTYTWNTCNHASSEQVSIYLNGPLVSGIGPHFIATVANTGSYTFMLPTVSTYPQMQFGNLYRAQIEVGGQQDMSDATFSINNPTSSGICTNAASLQISTNGTPVNLYKVPSVGQAHGIMIMSVPFSITASGCGQYISSQASQLNYSSPRNKIQFWIDNGNFIPSGASGTITYAGSDVMNPTSNGNYFIPLGQTKNFVLTSIYTLTTSGAYRIGLYDIPSSTMDTTQFTGNSQWGFMSNLVPNSQQFSTPYTVGQ